MAHLKLKDRELGSVQGVLFDKDGTLSHSEPRLIELADARLMKQDADLDREVLQLASFRS